MFPSKLARICKIKVVNTKSKVSKAFIVVDYVLINWIMSQCSLEVQQLGYDKRVGKNY